jgi:RNA polymerase sigma-70 factor (ECF subfamily)
MATETELIWAEFGRRLRAFIARRVTNEADVEDILQDVFLRIHQRAGTVRRADRLVSWLFQLTRNAIADHYRAPERRRELPSGDPSELPTDRPSATDQSEESDHATAETRRELASCLRPMVGRLPAPYRDAIGLVDLEGMTQPQAAARLGLSISGTKSRVQRGRRALKRMLQDCCRVSLDSGGRVVAYDVRGAACDPCAARCPSIDEGRASAAAPIGEP